jgi:hypothetical protein
MARKKKPDAPVNKNNTQDLVEAVRMTVEGRPKQEPKVTLGFRCDADLKAEAQKVFGSDVGFVLEAALRQAIKERKKM